MKTHAATVASVPAASEHVQQASRGADFVTLTKPRLNLLVLVTTLAGVYLAAPEGVPLPLLLHTLLGTTLVAGGAAALNQVWERDTDRLMRRTRTRPVPGGRLRVVEGAWFGALLSIVGIAELAFAVNASRRPSRRSRSRATYSSTHR